jgi:hypothetical protein
MNIVDFNFLYASGAVTKTIQTGDTFMIGRPNPQEGGGYSVFAIDQADLVSQIANQIPIKNSSAAQLLGIKLGLDMNVTTDQVISLKGGTRFVITDVLLTNFVLGEGTAGGFQIWDAINKTGNKLFTSVVNHTTINNTTHTVTQTGSDTLVNLVASSSYINKDSFLIANAFPPVIILGDFPLLTTNVVVGTSVYASLATAQGSPATADVSVYGYILA